MLSHDAKWFTRALATLASFATDLATFLARLNNNRAMRSFQHYTRQYGPLLRAGIGFNMFFSVTGLLTTGFAIAQIVLGGNPALQDAVIDGWTALIAAVVTAFVSLGPIDSIREGLRGS